MFSVRADLSTFGSGLITWGIAMARPVLTYSEVLEIVYDSDESFIDSDSLSSSDNEIDEIPVADAIVNDDIGDEEEIFHRDFRWETMDNFTGHREVLSCDFGPRNGAGNVSGIIECFELFFTNKSYNKLSEKLIGEQNNTKTPEAIFSHLDHL